MLAAMSGAPAGAPDTLPPFSALRLSRKRIIPYPQVSLVPPIHREIKPKRKDGDVFMDCDDALAEGMPAGRTQAVSFPVQFPMPLSSAARHDATTPTITFRKQECVALKFRSVEPIMRVTCRQSAAISAR